VQGGTHNLTTAANYAYAVPGIKTLTMRPNTIRASQKHFYNQYLHGVESFRAGGGDMPLNAAAIGLSVTSFVLASGGLVGIITK